MCKAIKAVDMIVLIIKYKLDKDEEAFIKVNESGLGIASKNTLINYTKAIPNFLWQIQVYFSNSQPNSRCLFSKFCLTCNIETEYIILILKEVLEDYKFCAKSQTIQYWDIEYLGWLFYYADSTD